MDDPPVSCVHDSQKGAQSVSMAQSGNIVQNGVAVEQEQTAHAGEGRSRCTDDNRERRARWECAATLTVTAPAAEVVFLWRPPWRGKRPPFSPFLGCQETRIGFPRRFHEYSVSHFAKRKRFSACWVALLGGYIVARVSEFCSTVFRFCVGFRIPRTPTLSAEPQHSCCCMLLSRSGATSPSSRTAP
jgi:hypothetical protein